jgi:hypothetical protein
MAAKLAWDDTVDEIVHCRKDKWKWKYQSNWTWSKVKTVSIIRDRMKGLGIVFIYQTHEMTLKSWPLYK